MCNINIENHLNISLEYKNLLQKCRKEKIDHFINNNVTNHAIYTLNTLINNSGKTINIFSGNMNEAVYDNLYLCKSLKKAREKDVKVTIILEKDADNKHINFCRKNGIIMRRLKKDIKLKKPNHFLISDGIAFRIEKPHTLDAFKKGKIEGLINFNNKEWANAITNRFSKLINASERI